MGCWSLNFTNSCGNRNQRRNLTFSARVITTTVSILRTTQSGNLKKNRSLYRKEDPQERFWHCGSPRHRSWWYRHVCLTNLTLKWSGMLHAQVCHQGTVWGMPSKEFLKLHNFQASLFWGMWAKQELSEMREWSGYRHLARPWELCNQWRTEQ